MDINLKKIEILIDLSFGINQLIGDDIQALIVGSYTCVCMGFFFHYWFYLESIQECNEN